MAYWLFSGLTVTIGGMKTTTALLAIMLLVAPQMHAKGWKKWLYAGMIVGGVALIWKGSTMNSHNGCSAVTVPAGRGNYRTYYCR